MRRLPLALRAPLLAAGLMVVLGLVASQLVLAGLARSQERQLVELAQLEFDGLTAALAPLVPRDDIWEMFDHLDRLTRRERGLRPVEATLVDPLGRVVVSSHPEVWPLGAAARALVAAAVPVEAFHYHAAAPEVTVRAVLTHQGRPLGQMVIAFDASALVAERARATRALLFGNLATTLFLAGAAWLAVRRLMRPMTRLIDQMGGGSAPPQAIRPADMPPGDGEVGRLYRSYNAMIRAVDERNAAKRRLAERERFVSLGRLAGTLAHEVNNPLGGLMNAVDTLRRYPDRPEVVAGSAELLDRGLRHLRDVVRATLYTQRGTEGEAPLGPPDLEDLRMLIQPEAERNGQRLDWEVRAAAPCLAGLPAGPVRQVVLNLALNACASAGAGGRLGVSLERCGDRLRLGVADSGPGLPERLRPRLLSDAPVEPGGGQGLRLVRDLVAGMGGDVALETTAEGLNEVVVRLPCARAEEV